MARAERASCPSDQQQITDLLRNNLAPGEAMASLESDCLRWKYWTPHPVFPGERSRVIESGNTLLAHGGIWPIQLATKFGNFNCFHLIDWAARPSAPGVGVQVLRQCGEGLAANFSIGGSATSRKILPVIGFKAYNPMWFLVRPLHPFERSLRGSVPDWKVPLRAVRNLVWYLYPTLKLPDDCKLEMQEPEAIPETLWPVAAPGAAVSERSPRLLEHIRSCPTVNESACVVIYRKSEPMAYVFLVQVGEQLRLADYGPVGLNEDASIILGIAVQDLARRLFPSATTLMAVTSEEVVQAGLSRAGFRLRREEPIRVLKIENGLDRIERFRLTLLDWDALCY